MKKEGRTYRLKAMDFWKKAVVFGVVILFAVSALGMLSLADITISADDTLNDLSEYNEEGFNSLDGPRSIVWDVQLNVTEPSGRNDNVVFGEAPEANDGGSPDIHDAPKPPAPFPPYIRAWFDDGLTTPYDLLDKDYRNYPDVYKVWNLTVKWDNGSFAYVPDITISWDASDVDNSEYDVVELWNATAKVADMLIESSYTYTQGWIYLGPPVNQYFWIDASFNIICNIMPEITDNTVGPAYTGDSFTFNASITDGSGLDTIWVEYWYGSGGHTNVSMTPAGANYFENTITVDNTTELLHYIISANDTADLWNNTGTEDVTVSDNDNPTLTDDSPTTGTTGDTYTFDVTPDDNIGVSSVTVTWNHGINGGTDVAMIDDLDDTYSLDVTLDDDLGDMDYTITVTDTSSNTFTDATQYVSVSDNDDPLISDIDATPDPQIVHGYVNITAIVTDNVNLDTVNVIISGPIGFTPINTSMIQDGGDTYYYYENYSTPGIYNYSIWVNDTSSNSVVSAMYQFEIVSQYMIRDMFIGWNFVSMPFNQSIDKTNLFVNYGGTDYNWTEATNISGDPIINPFIYGWNGNTYEPENILEAAHGYWIYAYKVCELWATNVSYRAIDGYITNLSVGWSAIGAPVDYNVSKSKLLVYYGGSEYNWTEASNLTNEIVDGHIYYYIGGSYLGTDELLAGESHWVYAYKECVLRWDIT